MVKTPETTLPMVWPHSLPQRAAEQTKILYSKSVGKQVDWSGYSYKARKIVRKNLRGRLVRMRSPVQIWVAAPKIPENCGFRGFFCCKKLLCGVAPNFWPTPWPTRGNETTETMDTRVPDRRKASCPAHFSFCLYRTCSMKLPIAAAASSCFCLVAWV